MLLKPSPLPNPSREGSRVTITQHTDHIIITSCSLHNNNSIINIHNNIINNNRNRMSTSIPPEIPSVTEEEREEERGKKN
eukprot:scaffold11445_cov113-Skeletonema_dohrnii-CCMP3373.AAC.6